MHHPTDRIAHTTAFVTPVVEHWLEREIAQWVHPMKDWSDDPSHHERTLLPQSYILLLHKKCQWTGFDTDGWHNSTRNIFSIVVLEMVIDFVCVILVVPNYKVIFQLSLIDKVKWIFFLWSYSVLFLSWNLFLKYMIQLVECLRWELANS